MDAVAILGIIGGIALLAALYGGLEIDKLKIAPLPVPIRYISGITGAIILIFTMWISVKSVTPPVTSTVVSPTPDITSETSLATSVLTDIATDIPTNMPTEIPTGVPTPSACGPLQITAVRPSAILENQIRLYKLIGNGFCRDTETTISGSGFVGNDPGKPSNSLPLEVSTDGTWLTVYIRPAFAPEASGQTITASNPDGNSATIFAGFQR